jgi:hypothetical protein
VSEKQTFVVRATVTAMSPTSPDSAKAGDSRPLLQATVAATTTAESILAPRLRRGHFQSEIARRFIRRLGWAEEEGSKIDALVRAVP